MSDGTPEQNLKQIFKIFDLNNDGKINQEEMNKITKDLSKLFNDDKNMAENIFKEMDENKDGEISEEEFIKACLSQKKCSKRFTLKIIGNETKTLFFIFNKSSPKTVLNGFL